MASLQQQTHPSYRRYSTLPLHQTARTVSQPDIDAPPATPPLVNSTAPYVRPHSTSRLLDSSFSRPNNDIDLRPPASTDTPAAIDYHLLDYVTEPDENLTCPICISPFVDPVVLESCDHCFCRACLRQSWQATSHFPGVPRGQCPTCRVQTHLASRGAVSKILVNILDELVVKCPMHAEGCTETPKRGALKDHVKLYCPYTWLDCPSPCCDLRVRRLDALEGSCMHSPASCFDCHRVLTVPFLHLHWQSECPDRQIDCEYCHEPVYKRIMTSHLGQDCDKITVPCPGAKYGCPIFLSRSLMSDHTKTCPLACLVPVLDAQHQQTARLAHDQAMLSRKVGILEGGLQSVQNILDSRRPFSETPARTPTPPLQSSSRFTAPFRERLPRALRTASRSRSASMNHTPSQSPTRGSRRRSQQANIDTPEPAAPFASPQHHLLALHEALREELARVSSAVHELDARHSLLIVNENMRLQDELAYMRDQTGVIARQVGWLINERLQGHRAASQSSASKDLATASNSVLAATSRAVAAVQGRGPDLEETRAATEIEVGASSSSSNLWRGSPGSRSRDEGRTKL